MNNENEITLTLTKKQLKSIILTMGVALDTDCKQMNEMSNKKLENISILHEVLQDISNQTK
jgi:hypothetical protein